jgi:hypothetical protein
MFRKFLFGAFFAVSIIGTANAQSFSMPMNNPVLDTVEFGRQIDAIVKQDSPKKADPQKAIPVEKKQVATVSPASFRYKISMERRKANYKSFIAMMKSQNEAGGKELEAALTKIDMIEMVRPALETSYGLRVDDIADAYTVWMVAAWGAVNSYEPDATRAQMQGVRKQVAQSLAAMLPLATASDEIKQNMAESLLINGLVVDEGARQARKDPIMGPKIAAAVQTNMKRDMGIDFSTITLTDQGFAPVTAPKKNASGR